MYVRDPKRGAPLGSAPMTPQSMPTAPQAAQHAPMSPEDPNFVDMVKQQAMGKLAGKGVDKGMEMAAPMMENAWAAMKAPFMNSTAATGAMNAGVDAGIANMMTGATGAATAGAGTGMMAGLGTAMPWLGAGMLGAKMLGLFSEGGLVGPLAGIKYKSNGGEISDEYQVNFVSPLSAKE